LSEHLREALQLVSAVSGTALVLGIADVQLGDLVAVAAAVLSTFRGHRQVPFAYADPSCENRTTV